MKLGALIGEGALNRANTVNTLEKMIKCDAALEIISDSEISLAPICLIRFCS